MGSENYLLGGANVFWSNKGENGFLDIGNIVSFNLTRAITELEHFTASTGERKLDKSIITQAQLGMNFNIDEFNADNVNLLMFGDGKTSVVESGGSVSDEVVKAPTLLGNSIFTAKSNISNLVVGDDAIPTTTYVLDTDYKIINAVTGEIQILAGGSIVADQDLYLDYNNGARTRDQVLPGTAFVKDGKVRFEFLASNGKPITWIVQNATLKVEGDVGLTSEAFSEANVVIEVLEDQVVNPSEPYGKLLVG